MKTLVLYRLAIAWAILFAVGSVCSCIMVGFNNVHWQQLDGQGKFLLVVGIVMNLSVTLGAFISKAAQAVQAGQLPIGNGGAANPPVQQQP